jgi:hypothetical protein
MGERSASQEAYRMASDIVRLLNKAIDEESDPVRRGHLKSALEYAHEGEDTIARALEIEAKAAARTSRDS